MKIMLVRHAEPDYENDTLTEKGFIEAAALKDYFKDLKIDAAYTSTLPRAYLTADISLEGHDVQAIRCPWLVEFNHELSNGKNIPWDFLPEYFTAQNEFYDDNQYLNHPLMKNSNIGQFYDEVTKEFDKVLASHGYVREGRLYKVEKPNRDTIVFYCHLGVMGVLLSHLTGIPFLICDQMFCVAPSGVTLLTSEERRSGIAQFRMNRYGDISHLALKGLEPSFFARFCETYDSDERHD